MPSAISDSETTEEADRAIPVAALPLHRGSIEAVLRYSTNLEAESEVGVYAEATRQVTRLAVEEGDRVKKGQILVRLQDDVQRSAVARAESQLAKARREYDRQEHLFQQELISEQAFTEATYEKEQLEITLADAQRELGYAVVTAPIAGVVTERMVSLGDYVQSNQHLFNIVDFNSIVARIFVPEKELARLSPGQTARLLAQALGSEPRHAEIARIAPTVDPRSGTVKVTLEIPQRAGLVPGMYVEVELVAATEQDALLVPKRALVYDQDQVFVFRAQRDEAEQGDAIVERLLIQPLLEDRDFVQVASGLAAGDLIVVAGQAGLKSGTEVRLLDLQEAIETFAGGDAEAALATVGR